MPRCLPGQLQRQRAQVPGANRATACAKDLVVEFDVFEKKARSNKLGKQFPFKEQLGWSKRLLSDGSFLADGQKQALEGREGLVGSTASWTTGWAG